MKTRGNDSAFPEIETEIEHQQGVQFNRIYSQNGLSKREYLATHILAGMMANPERYKYIKKQVEAGPDRGGLSQQEASAKNAHKAVLLADALIEELNKPKEQETNGKSKI